jgi:hypothetical protein
MASLTPTPKQPARGVASVLLCDWSWPQPLKQEAAPLSLSVRQQPTTRIPQQCNQEFPFCFSVKNPPGEGKQSVGVQQPRGKGGKKGLIPEAMFQEEGCFALPQHHRMIRPPRFPKDGGVQKENLEDWASNLTLLVTTYPKTPRSKINHPSTFIHPNKTAKLASTRQHNNLSHPRLDEVNQTTTKPSVVYEPLIQPKPQAASSQPWWTLCWAD